MNKLGDNLSKKLQFFYEVNWRIETSLSSVDIDWFIDALDDLTYEKIDGLDGDDYPKKSGVQNLFAEYLSHHVKGRCV